MHIGYFLSDVNFEIIARIVIAILLGFTIGIERELTNKWAGLRTHILVCLGSAVFTILSLYAFPKPGTPLSYGDPARVAAQILTGIGFIGGGTVLRHGSSIKGLTTAASLWVSASLGMAAGCGQYLVAIVTAILAILVLILIRKLEVGFLSKFVRKDARIKATVFCHSEICHDVLNWFYSEFPYISEISQEKSSPDDELTKISLTFDVVDTNPIGKAYKKIKELKNIDSICLRQLMDEG